MPPTPKISREEILSAAFLLVRTQGIEALGARALANKLHLSTQPIFSHFATMDALKQEVYELAQKTYQKALEQAVEAARLAHTPLYKATGLAYIRFAREERHLFHWLFMRDRSAETISEDADSIAPILQILQAQTGLDREAAYRLHLESWIFVHGCATMLATGYLPWDDAQIDLFLRDMYLGFSNLFISQSQKPKKES